MLAFLARRRSGSALLLREPGPTAAEIDDLIRLAARVPDHGKLGPWRFVILEGAGKAAFAETLEAIAAGRPDAGKCVTKLGKLKAPPLGIAVVSHVTPGEIPEWEQLMSAGAAAMNLLTASHAMGFAAAWLTEWYAYDRAVLDRLGLAPNERIAGFVHIGHPAKPPEDRDRPKLDAIVTRYPAGR